VQCNIHGAACYCPAGYWAKYDLIEYVDANGDDIIFNSYKVTMQTDTEYLFCSLYPSDDFPDYDAFWNYRDGSTRDYIVERGGPDYGGFDEEGVYYYQEETGEKLYMMMEFYRYYTSESEWNMDLNLG